MNWLLRLACHCCIPMRSFHFIVFFYLIWFSSCDTIKKTFNILSMMHLLFTSSNHCDRIGIAWNGKNTNVIGKNRLELGLFTPKIETNWWLCLHVQICWFFNNNVTFTLCTIKAKGSKVEKPIEIIDLLCLYWETLI